MPRIDIWSCEYLLTYFRALSVTRTASWCPGCLAAVSILSDGLEYLRSRGQCLCPGVPGVGVYICEEVVGIVERCGFHGSTDVGRVRGAFVLVLCGSVTGCFCGLCTMHPLYVIVVLAGILVRLFARTSLFLETTAMVLRRVWPSLRCY